MLLDGAVCSVSSCPDESDSDFSIAFSSAAQAQLQSDVACPVRA